MLPHYPESLRLRRSQRALFGAGIHKRTQPPTLGVPLELGDSVLLDLPDSWDIHDQGARGACVAHAAIACLEYHVFRETNVLTPLSEQFIHFKMRELQLQQHIVSDRTWLSEATKVLETQGVCLQSECLYSPFPGPNGDAGDPPSAEAIKSAQTRKFAAKVLEHPEDNGVLPAVFVVERLRCGQAAAISIPVQVLPLSNGVTNWTKRLGRYFGIVADPGGDCPDGHAVCIVGYLKDHSAAGGGWFVCRNSWGLEWASEAQSEQPFAVSALSGRGYGVISAAYLNSLCSEIFTVSGADQDQGITP